MNRKTMKRISMALVLALALQMAPVAIADDAAAAAVVTGTFQNVSENGENMISLSEARSYKVMIPVDTRAFFCSPLSYSKTRCSGPPFSTSPFSPVFVRRVSVGVSVKLFK